MLQKQIMMSILGFMGRKLGLRAVELWGIVWLFRNAHRLDERLARGHTPTAPGTQRGARPDTRAQPRYVH